jgi:hypothetical protein
VQLVGVSGVVVNGLTMRPGSLTNTQAGVNIQSNNPSGITTITIENNDIGGFQYYTTSNALFHATFSGNVMTVTDVISGEVRIGQSFNDTTHSFQGPPRVVGYGTGTGGAGTYTVTPSLTGHSCVAANPCKTAGNTGAEIWIDGTIYFVAGVHVLNNTLHGLSGTSSLDNIGIAGYGVPLSLGGNQYGHVYQGNLIYNIGGVAGIDVGPNGSGIMSTNSTVATMQFNLTHDLMDNTTTCGAGFAQWADVADRVTIQMGESYNNGLGRTQGCDSGSVDFDQSTTNSVAQYFYSHENFGPGILFFEGTNGGVNRYGPNTARYNISENDAQGGPNNAGGIGCYNSGGSSYFPGDVYFYNNTEWMGTPHGTNGAFNTCVNMTGAVANNIFATAKNSSGLFAYILNCCGAGSTDNAVFSHNLYYSIGSGGRNSWNPYGTNYSFMSAWQAAIPGGDAGAILAGSPPVSSGGSGGTCVWTPSTISRWPPGGCPSAYGSQTMVKSAGNSLLPTSGWPGGAPSRDYYGNTVPGSGPCYNIGAWGVCP